MLFSNNIYMNPRFNSLTSVLFMDDNTLRAHVRAHDVVKDHDPRWAWTVGACLPNVNPKSEQIICSF
jgi:hypothetical protein